MVHILLGDDRADIRTRLRALFDTIATSMSAARPAMGAKQ